MTLEEFLKKRTSKTFTPGEIVYLLEKCGYCYKFIDTFVKPGKHTWRESGLNEADAQQKIYNLNYGKIPYHFSYIKFYLKKDGTGPYALVAGKTNLGNPDFYFLLKGVPQKSKDTQLNIAALGANKAKAFLADKKEGGDWYCQEVLAVWPLTQSEFFEKPDDKHKKAAGDFALSVEADVGGLFGLFSS